MPEQTDKRRSWWGILTPSEKAPQNLSGAARSSQPDLFGAYMQDSDVKARMHDHHPDFMASTTSITKSDNNGPASVEGTQSLRRASSKLDLFKKGSLSKRTKTNNNGNGNSNGKGASKFATITTAWSSSRSTLPGRSAAGSVSSTTMDLTHFEKAAAMEELQQQDDVMVFTISEQQDMVDGERERDVAYTIRAEGITKIILITRRISDFLDFDEKVRVQFPKSRPALPLLDDRRKSSFLVSTRQFFFPRKNIAEKLEVYLRKVASHEPLKSSAIFHEFLAVSQEGDLVHSKEQPSKGFGFGGRRSMTRGFSPYKSGEEEGSSKSDLELNGSDSDSSAAFHHQNGNGNHRQGQNGAQHQQQHVEETVEVVRREPKMRGNRVRPGLPQIQERKKVSIEDFQLIKVLGRGCMGKVMLVREHKSKRLFALKAISKEWVILQREIEHTKSERNILANVARISHPFLIKLRHSFQSNAQLFMVLDYYPGGDIATQLAKWHKFEPERCLFYAAEIVLGIEELHRQGIVYRDLKPENILLAFDGHIVLTDFGLSKQFPTFSASSPYLTEDKTNTFCGTAEYLAPEILRAAEYSYAVDWWSLGTLLYEMLSGITPFWAENHAQMYQRVLEDELEFPMEIDQYAASFIAGLLERDPDNRLGSQGVHHVKNHPYFDTIDWDMALKRQLPCPYLPDLVSEEDLSNFDDAFLTMTPRLSPGNHTLSNSIQNCFQGYSYSDNRLGSTLPRSDSKIKLDHRAPNGVNGGTVGPGGSYIDGFDQEGPNPPTRMETNGPGHGQGYGNHHGTNGNTFKGNPHQHQPLHRSPLQQMDLRNSQYMDTDDIDLNDDPHNETDDFEEDDFYRHRPLTQLYAPPSAAMSASLIDTKAPATSPTLTPPTTYPDDGKMATGGGAAVVVVVDRISTTKMGAAADILRGYSERSSIDTQRHNSTGSSHSSGTIGRRLSRGYV
ncbi:hypothetical protein BGZ95_011127 [Linnemannia exigua]|uniref:Uncharacterized protein n=1 Tax=Linnemannia exigua TaxID=604196 RepID=A0AAD4H5E6_9FUNG|nr:hypothetical protein BGZ95_011127 [Linnemannia exigua]